MEEENHKKSTQVRSRILAISKFFGNLAFVQVLKEGRKKLDNKTQACLFWGYDEESKNFRLFDPKKCKVMLSRDVV